MFCKCKFFHLSKDVAYETCNHILLLLNIYKKLWIYSTSWKTSVTRIYQSNFTMDGQEICIVAASHLQRLWQTECNLGIRSVRMTCDICQLVVQYCCYLVSIFCCYRSILISCERCELFISLQRSREPKCVVGRFGKFYSLWKLSSFFLYWFAKVHRSGKYRERESRSYSRVFTKRHFTQNTSTLKGQFN